MLVEEIKVGQRDSSDAEILDIYAKQLKRYAVYRTAERVAVEYADDESLENAQRGFMARLNPLRNDINGLIDGWRTGRNKELKSKSRVYERRIADALILAFEDDAPSALLLLQDTKKDILEERISWARFQYVLVASSTVACVLLAITIMSSARFQKFYAFPEPVWNLWLGSAAGALGAFFSIAIGIQRRTVLPDLKFRDNAADAVLRITIGLIASILLICLLICLLLSGAVQLSIGDASAHGPNQWAYIFLAGFIAGFSERLVPDLRAKSMDTFAPPQTATKGPAADGAPGGGGGFGSERRTFSPAAPQPAPAAAAAADAADEDDDTCTADAGAQDHELTRDADLPPARGGVEP